MRTLNIVSTFLAKVKFVLSEYQSILPYLVKNLISLKIKCYHLWLGTFIKIRWYVDSCPKLIVYIMTTFPFFWVKKNILSVKMFQCKRILISERSSKRLERTGRIFRRSCSWVSSSRWSWWCYCNCFESYVI